MSNTETTNDIPVSINFDQHLEAVVNIEAVQAMPENTIGQIAAKWLAAKTIENAGNTAKSIRSSMGEKLEEAGVTHENRLYVNGQRYVYTVSTGMSSGVTINAVNAFKNRYHRVPWVARALDQAINDNRTVFTKRGLRIG